MLTAPEERVISWVDPLCMHLTSERAKERSTSLTRLKDVCLDSKQASSLTAADCNKMIQAFSRMLAIEFKLAKGGEISANVETKFRQLMRDARQLLTALIAVSSLVDSISKIMEILIVLLKSQVLILLHSDILVALNCILADPVHLRAIPSNYVHTLWYTCSRCASRPMDLECIRAIKFLSSFCYEFNDTKLLKEISTFVIEYLAEHGLDALSSTAAVPLLYAFRNCVRTLSESHPSFTRKLIRRLLTLLTPNLFRKKGFIDKVLSIFNETWFPCNFKDPTIMDAINTFIKQSFRKLRLEEKYPVEIDLGNDHYYQIVFHCLSLYCPPQYELFSETSLSTDELDMNLAFFYSHHAFHNSTPSMDKLSEAFIKVLPKCSIVNQQWLLPSLVEQAPIEKMNAFILEAIINPQLGNAAVHYLTKLRFSTKIQDLPWRLSFIPLTSHSIYLLAKNFESTYSGLFWTRSAKRYYDDSLQLVLKSFHQDPKLVAGKLISLLPPTIDFIYAGGALDDDFYNWTAQRFINSVIDLLSNYCEPESLKTHLSSKWSENRITLQQTIACLQLPLIIFINRDLQGSSPSTLLEQYQHLEDLKCAHCYIQWILPMLNKIIVNCRLFHVLHIPRLLSMLISQLESACKDENTSDSFFSKNDASWINSNITTFVHFYNFISELSDLIHDEEVSAIRLDCIMYLFEKINHFKLSSELVILIFETLKEIPSNCSHLVLEFFLKFCKNSCSKSVANLAAILLECSTMKDITLEIARVILTFQPSSVPPATRKIFKEKIHGKFELQLQKIQSNELIYKKFLFWGEAVKNFSKNVPKCIDDIDYIPAFIQKMKEDAQQNQDFLLEMNAVFLNVPFEDDDEYLYGDIREELQNIFYSHDNLDFRPAALAFLRARTSNVSLLLQVMLRYAKPQPKAICFWDNEFENVTLPTSFAISLARSILCHYQGESVHSANSLSLLKSKLSELQFSSLFKLSFFKILAVVYLHCQTHGIFKEGKYFTLIFYL